MSKNIVFIVNLQDKKKPGRDNPYHYSIDSWKTWCNKNDCELFVLTDRIQDESVMNANWHKLYVFDLLDANEIDYDQILISDADIIIHPDAPNIFNETEHKFCGVHNQGSYDWVCRSIENYKQFLFPDIDFPFWEYINSGMLVMNKKHKELYSKILDFYLDKRSEIQYIQENYGVGTDQPVINFFLHKENIDYKILPYKWNMQDMARKEILDDNLTFTKLGWIYHFNAIPNNEGGRYTQYFMEKTYKTLYDNK